MESARNEDESGHPNAALQVELLFKSSSKCAWAWYLRADISQGYLVRSVTSGCSFNAVSLKPHQVRCDS